MITRLRVEGEIWRANSSKGDKIDLGPESNTGDRSS